MEIARFLVEELGVDIEETDVYNGTVFNWSVFRRHYDITLYFLQRGANLNKREFEFNTPLTIAVKRQAHQFIDLLLENKQRGVDLNNVFYDQGVMYTPLVFAIKVRFDITVVRQLIRAGVDVNNEDSDYTALEVALE